MVEDLPTLEVMEVVPIIQEVLEVVHHMEEVVAHHMVVDHLMVVVVNQQQPHHHQEEEHLVEFYQDFKDFYQDKLANFLRTQ